jgi:DNA polymerase/3'-5' exonuclease PolX
MGDKRPLQEAERVASEVCSLLEPHVTRQVIAGSIRRRRPEVKDIEIVAEPAMVPDGFLGERRPCSVEIKELAATWGRLTKGGEKYVQVEDVLGSGLALDLFLVTPPASWGAILAIRTGPAAYSQMLVSALRGRLMRCEDGRVVSSGLLGLDEEVWTPDEESFFGACGVRYVPPEQRGVFPAPTGAEVRT